MKHQQGITVEWTRKTALDPGHYLWGLAPLGLEPKINWAPDDSKHQTEFSLHTRRGTAVMAIALRDLRFTS